MMEAVFLKILNMSLTASWLILAVVALRVILKNAPKALRVLLWAFVGLRLILPFSIESPVSLIPDSEPIPQSAIYVDSSQINYDIPEPDTSFSPMLENTLPEPTQTEEPMDLTKTVIRISAAVWIAGVCGLLIYAGFSYLKIAKKVAVRLPIAKSVFLCDHVDSPFILGIFRPKIYIPSELSEEQRNHVIAHERAHLKRKDHWWKPLGFLILCIHWFNPLIWVSYILLCRDIELACDEKAVKTMDCKEKRNYTETLLSCSISRITIRACPLAFGEVAVKERVKTVLNYKKPAFWIILTAIVTCIVVAVCFLTNPTSGTSITDLENQSKTFKNVSQVAVVTEHLGYTSTEIPETRPILQVLKSLRLEKTPLDSSRNELRDRQNTVRIIYETSETELCFNEDCTELWINDGVKPSFTYQVQNPESITQLFDRTYKTGERCLFEGITLDNLIEDKIADTLIGSGAGRDYEYNGTATPYFQDSYRILAVEQKDLYVFTVLVQYNCSIRIYGYGSVSPTFLYGPESRPATFTFNIQKRDDGVLYYHQAEHWISPDNAVSPERELDQHHSRSRFGEVWTVAANNPESATWGPTVILQNEEPQIICPPTVLPKAEDIVERINDDTIKRNTSKNQNVVFRCANIYGIHGTYTNSENQEISFVFGTAMYKEYGETIHPPSGDKTWTERKTVSYPIYVEFPDYDTKGLDGMEYHILTGPDDPVLNELKDSSSSGTDLYGEPWEMEAEHRRSLELLCITEMIQHTGYDPNPVIEELFRLVTKSASTQAPTDFSEEYPEECATLISLASYSRDYIYRQFLTEDLSDLETRRMWYVLANVLNKDAWLQTARNEETRVENPITERDLSPIVTDGKQAFDRLVQFVKDVEAKFEQDHTLGNSDMEQLRQLIENLPSP